MDYHFLHEFKRQASFFFKDKIKAARLALLDATPAQLLTEEATTGDSSAPDTRTMRVISRAAFEVDDYWRIVEILHKRLEKHDRQNWRASYKAIILLEHLLTHGPARIAEEFQDDKEIIREIANFRYVDEKGFNWGASVQRKTERVVKLIENEPFLKEERARERKLTVGIKGFGSFSQKPTSTTDESSGEPKSERYTRWKSHFSNYQSQEEGTGDICIASKLAQRSTIDRNQDEDVVDHPFCSRDHHQNQTLVSLLSSS